MGWTGIVAFVLWLLTSPIFARVALWGDGQVAAFIMNADRWGRECLDESAESGSLECAHGRPPVDGGQLSSCPVTTRRRRQRTNSIAASLCPRRHRARSDSISLLRSPINLFAGGHASPYKYQQNCTITTYSGGAAFYITIRSLGIMREPERGNYPL